MSWHVIIASLTVFCCHFVATLAMTLALAIEVWFQFCIQSSFSGQSAEFICVFVMSLVSSFCLSVVHPAFVPLLAKWLDGLRQPRCLMLKIFAAQNHQAASYGTLDMSANESSDEGVLDSDSYK